MTSASIYVHKRMAVNNSSWIMKWFVNTTLAMRYKRPGWINSSSLIGVDVFWPFTMVNPQLSALWEIYPFLPVIIHYNSSWNQSMNVLHLFSFVPAQGDYPNYSAWHVNYWQQLMQCFRYRIRESLGGGGKELRPSGLKNYCQRWPFRFHFSCFSLPQQWIRF